MPARTTSFACNAILSVSGGRSLFRGDRALIFILYGVVQGALLYIGAKIDNSLTLPGTGRGLLRHYGVWSIVVTDPLIILNVAIAHAMFRRAIFGIRFSSSAERKLYIRNSANISLDLLYMKGYSAWAYRFLVCFGLLCWMNNIHQTMEPGAFFGNDVFDQTAHPWGFIANKVNLFVSWVIIYPAAGFLLMFMCLRTRVLLENAKILGGLKGDLFHPDRCFGFANLAWLNISLLTPFIFSFLVMFFHSITHERIYESLIFPFIGLFLIFIFSSFWIIRPVVIEAREIYKSAYKSVLRLTGRPGWEWDKVNYNLSLTRLCLASTNSSPYAGIASTLLTTLRLLPAALAIARLILPTPL